MLAASGLIQSKKWKSDWGDDIQVIAGDLIRRGLVVTEQEKFVEKCGRSSGNGSQMSQWRRADVNIADRVKGRRYLGNDTWIEAHDVNRVEAASRIDRSVDSPRGRRMSA